MSSRNLKDVHRIILAGLEVEPGEEGRLAAHAAGCPECDETLRTEELLRRHFHEALAPVPSSFVQATCARALAGREPSAPLWWIAVPLSWRLGLAALIVLAALGGLSAGRGGAQPAGQVTEQRLTSLMDAPELVAMRTSVPSTPEGGEQ